MRNTLGMWQTQLIEEAERIYRAIGTLPFDMAVKLIEEGYDVDRLEQQWDQTKHEAR